MRDWTEPEMSMSAGGYVSGSDGYGISEPLQYYDVLVDPLAYPFQEPEFQGLPYGQPHYNPTNLHFSMFGPQGPPSCNPPYPYRPYSPLGQELPCEPDSESPVPGRAGAPGGGLPLMKRPRLGPGARVRGQDELCVVCGDKASGYHYNALTCEGCKGFFRRSVTKKAVYRCKSGGGCEMDMYMRRKCQDCRLRKCRAVGMLAECLLTEVQCQSKRLRKGAKPRGDPGYGGRPEDEDGTESRSVTSTSRLPGRVSSSLSREQKCVLNRIVDAYRCCRAHHPAYSRVPEWSDFEEGGGRLGEMFSPHMERLQQFSKSIPGFELLDYADQNTLLSSSIIEILFLLSAQRFSENPSAFSAALYPISVNHSSPDWLKAEESQNGGNEILTNSGVSEDVLRSVLNFFHSMAAIVVTEAEYALLVATALLCSDRPMLRAGGCVESLQELVLELLSRVCQTQSAAGGAHDPRRFARLLGRLTELRTLRHNHVTLIQQHPWEIQP